MADVEFNRVMLVLVIVGWAFNLGILWQMTRNHKEKLKEHDDKLTDLANRVSAHHEKTEVHTTVEWREEIRDWMSKLDGKLDAIQRQCLERITKGQCV